MKQPVLTSATKDTMRKLILALFALSLPALAQYPTTPDPTRGPNGTGTPLTMYRLGGNMGGTDFFGSGEFLKDMACVMNCGFEPVLAQTVFVVATTGTTTQFNGTNAFDLGNGQQGAGQDGFNLWVGATVTVREAQASGNKGYVGTITANQGSIQATTCSATSTSPFTITCNADNNPIAAGFAVSQPLNWETPAGTGYASGFDCCTATAVSSTQIAWSQPAKITLGVAGTSGYATAASLPTTNSCSGSGMTISITAASGKVATGTISAAGSGYAVGCHVFPTQGGSSSDAYFVIGGPTGTATGGFIGNNVVKTYTVTPAASNAFSLGDQIVIKLTQSPTPNIVWTASTNASLGLFGNNMFSQNTGGGSLSSVAAICGACGSQSLRTTVTSSGDAAGAGVLMDDSNGAAENFTSLVGTYQASVTAKLISGTSPKLVLKVTRNNVTICTTTITPTSTSTVFPVSCTLAETATQTPGILQIIAQNTYNGAPAVIDIDNLSFKKTSGLDPANTSAYKDEFFHAWQDRCATTVPGARCVVRNWTSQNQETFASWSGTYQTALQAGLNPSQGKAALKLYDYLNFVEALGNADPYVEIPVTMTPADAALTVEFINGTSSTTGGAVRAALGHTAPYAFSKIWTTPCNECWNGAAAYQNLPARTGVPNCSTPSTNPDQYYDLSLWITDVATAMRADASYSSAFQIGFPAQTANPSGIYCALQRSKPDYVEFNNYKQFSVANAGTTASLLGAKLAEPFVNVTSTSASGYGQAANLVTGFSVCGASGTAQCYPTTYETNTSTQLTCNQGSPACTGSALVPPFAITQPQEDIISAGMTNVETEPLAHLLNCITWGSPNNPCITNVFAAVEYTNSGPLGNNTFKGWGDTIDYGGQMSQHNGVQYSPRPTMLGEIVLNRAIVGPMIYSPITSPPTYNWPGDPYNGFPKGAYLSSGGTPALAGIQYLTSFSFNTGSKYGTVWINTNLTASYTVTPGGSFGFQGTVLLNQVDATNSTALCEGATGALTNTATACGIHTATLTNPASIVIPPGITSITYTIGTPVAATPTFSPVAGTYTVTQNVTISTTTAGATICYTTDGSTPLAATPGTCSHGSTYTSAVTVASSLTINAIATIAGSTNSATGSAAYTITPATVANPVFAPPGGTVFMGSLSVALSTTTPTAKICYTTDGTTPTASSGTCTHGTLYSSAIAISTPTTIQAIGTLSGFTNSSVIVAVYSKLLTGPITVTGTLTVNGSLTLTQQ